VLINIRLVQLLRVSKVKIERKKKACLIATLTIGKTENRRHSSSIPKRGAIFVIEEHTSEL
jgi:hypothetical protein